MKLRKLSGLAAAPVGLLLSGLLVVGASSAAFTAQTATDSNTWTAAGQIALTLNEPGTTLFATDGITLGASGFNTVTVIYTGAELVDIALTATEVDGGLAEFLQLTITDSANGEWTGSLADLVAGTGAALPWNAASSVEREFTIHWAVAPEATQDDIAGKFATAVFTWTATTVSPPTP